MKRISTDKTEIVLEQNTYTLEYIKKAFQNTPHVDSDYFRYLGIELCGLMERVLKDNDKKQQMLESYGLVQIQEITDENNFDLDKESVRKIILKEISMGQIFYPSDICNKHNLDLEMVMIVINELRESGQIINKPK